MKTVFFKYVVFVLGSVKVQANGSFEPILNHLSPSSIDNIDCRADSMCLDDSQCGTDGVCDLTRKPTNMDHRVINLG